MPMMQLQKRPVMPMTKPAKWPVMPPIRLVKWQLTPTILQKKRQQTLPTRPPKKLKKVLAAENPSAKFECVSFSPVFGAGVSNKLEIDGIRVKCQSLRTERSQSKNYYCWASDFQQFPFGPYFIFRIGVNSSDLLGFFPVPNYFIAPSPQSMESSVNPGRFKTKFRIANYTYSGDTRCGPVLVWGNSNHLHDHSASGQIRKPA